MCTAGVLFYNAVHTVYCGAQLGDIYLMTTSSNHGKQENVIHGINTTVSTPRYQHHSNHVYKYRVYNTAAAHCVS